MEIAHEEQCDLPNWLMILVTQTTVPESKPLPHSLSSPTADQVFSLTLFLT
jgi:hypothetical protein